MFVPILLVEPDGEKRARVLQRLASTELRYGGAYLTYTNESLAKADLLEGASQTVLICDDFLELQDSDPYKTLVMEMEDFVFAIMNSGAKRKRGQ